MATHILILSFTALHKQHCLDYSIKVIHLLIIK